MTTGSDLQLSSGHRLAAGCEAYLLKPINTRELSGQLTAVAEGGDAVK